MVNNCAVIISSCDAYEDAWAPFFTLFFRYWPDCPFPIYLISNEVTYLDSRIRPLRVGPDRGWANNTKKAMKQISEPFIIFILEDLFLEKPTNTEYILQLLEHIKEQHAATIRLFPSPLPDEDYPNDLNLGRMGRDAPYRTSLMIGIWDKKIFISLIKEDENAWQMEIDGTERSRFVSEAFISVKTPAIHYYERTGIIRGKWMYQAVKLCKREGIVLDLKRRKVDYALEWRSRLDKYRKSGFARMLKSIPGLRILAKNIYRYGMFMPTKKP